VIASLKVSTASTPAPVDQNAMTTSEMFSEDPLQSVPVEAVDSILPAERISIDSGLAIAETPEAQEPDRIALDLDAAATSRILESQPMTQCGFTCLDPNSGTSFPMTGYISPMSLVDPVEAQAVHARICSSAGLMPKQNTQASCGLN